MWRIVTTLRERIPATSTAASITSCLKKSTSNGFGKNILKRSSSNLAERVTIQLDYYMSLQFAGIANAMVSDLYTARGISVSFLPTCPVGLEQRRVRDFQDANPSVACVVGTAEQNVFVPNLWRDSSLRTTGVASMFRRSPLCVASFSDDLEGGDEKTISAHEDTVHLMQRVFPKHRVVGSARGSKCGDLVDGLYDGIQAYSVTEVPTLRRNVAQREVFVHPLEGRNGAKLGYSQLIFAADECLEEGDRRAVLQSFLEATFEGWAQAIREKDPRVTLQAVKEAQGMLALDEENNDHWHPSVDFEEEMLRLCNNEVKESFEGDRYGVINPARWSEANRWLLQENNDASIDQLGLDSSVWKPPSELLCGNELSRCLLEEASTSASSFSKKFGRKPSLCVITVGELKRYKHSDRRLQLYSNPANSWFSKTQTGSANGFDVKEVQLDENTTTTDILLSEIYKASVEEDCDGIQLMWPLPKHIDAQKVYNAIDKQKDVDGIHFVGQSLIENNKAYPPVTPSGIMALLKHNNIDVRGKRVLVIGRSLIVGSPLAHMLQKEGAATSLLHSEVPQSVLKSMVGESDIIIPCVGEPGVIKAEWVDKNAIVINGGTTFLPESDALQSDVEGDLGVHCSRYSPVPGGVGPLSLPHLLLNTAQAAWNQASSKLK